MNNTGEKVIMTMLDYIYEQPELYLEVLKKRVENTEVFTSLYAKECPDCLYLVASGTSKNAASAAAPFMEEVLDIPVTVVESSRATRLRGKNPLAIYISQGGNSTNTISAIKNNRHILGLVMSGNPEGVLNTLCSQYLEIPCGEETAGPKTKGYTITILVLYLMALEASKKIGSISKIKFDEYLVSLEETGKNLQENIENSHAWVLTNEDDFRHLSKVYMVGKGQGMSIANEGALKVMETLLVPSVGFEFEEYLHGPTCSLANDVSGFYLLPASTDVDYERMRRLISYHREICTSVFSIGLESDHGRKDLSLKQSGHWYTEPFTQILPMQLISALVPPLLNLEYEGSKRFKAIDSVMGVKVKK